MAKLPGNADEAKADTIASATKAYHNGTDHMNDRDRAQRSASRAVIQFRPIALASALSAMLTACGGQEIPPTTDEIRRAYAAHLISDPVHERGLEANQPPAVIPNQDPICIRDSNSHFDCRIKVIFETGRKLRSEEQTIHIQRETGRWVIDSLN